MEDDLLIPRSVTLAACTVAEVTGVEPTITRQPRRRWLLELRTDRVYATAWFREDMRTGKTVIAPGATVEVDGQRRDCQHLEAIADLIRYPDGKPGTLEPPTDEIPLERAPRLVRAMYQELRAQLAKQPEIRIHIVRGLTYDIDIAIYLNEHSGIRMPFRKIGRDWMTCDQQLVVIVDGFDRSHEVSTGGLAEALKLLMTARGNQPAAPDTIGTPSAAKTTSSSVSVRNNSVMRI